MSTPLIPAAASVGSTQPTAAHLALFPQRADELRSFLLDLPVTGSVMLPVAQDLCHIAFSMKTSPSSSSHLRMAAATRKRPCLRVHALLFVVQQSTKHERWHFWRRLRSLPVMCGF